MLERRWYTPKNYCVVMVAHWALLSAINSRGDIDCPVRSLLLSLRDLAFFLCNDQIPLFPVILISAVGTHGRTMIAGEC